MHALQSAQIALKLQGTTLKWHRSSKDCCCLTVQASDQTQHIVCCNACSFYISEVLEKRVASKSMTRTAHVMLGQVPGPTCLRATSWHLYHAKPLLQQGKL